MGASKLSHGPPCLSHLNLSLLTIQSVTVLIQQLLHISTLLGVKQGLPLSFILPSSTTSSAMTTLWMEASGAFQAFSFINVGCQRLVPSVRDSYLVGNCCYLLNHLVGTICPQASHWGQQPLLALGHRKKCLSFTCSSALLTMLSFAFASLSQLKGGVTCIRVRGGGGLKSGMPPLQAAVALGVVWSRFQVFYPKHAT